MERKIQSAQREKRNVSMTIACVVTVHLGELSHTPTRRAPLTHGRRPCRVTLGELLLPRQILGAIARRHITVWLPIKSGPSWVGHPWFLVWGKARSPRGRKEEIAITSHTRVPVTAFELVLNPWSPAVLTTAVSPTGERRRQNAFLLEQSPAGLSTHLPGPLHQLWKETRSLKMRQFQKKHSTKPSTIYGKNSQQSGGSHPKGHL